MHILSLNFLFLCFSTRRCIGHTVYVCVSFGEKLRGSTSTSFASGTGTHSIDRYRFRVFVCRTVSATLLLRRQSNLINTYNRPDQTLLLLLLQIFQYFLFTFSQTIRFVFQSNAFIVSLRSSVHNVALALLFAGLLQRALFLRAQKWIGLGGKISMLNQCLTLLFIFAVQLALEMQRWRYVKPSSIC